MKECEYYDNWCEKEKRTCNNCYYERYYEEMEEVNKKFIAVDKIKAKIEELKQKKYILSSRESEIEILQSLLDEEE